MSIYDSILFATALVIAVYQSTEEGMIFGFLHKYKLIWWLKPIIGCPVCMGFWYGAAVSLTIDRSLVALITGVSTLALCELYVCLLSISYKE